jgi:hypothetical protein
MNTKQKFTLLILVVITLIGSVAVIALSIKPARVLGLGETLPDRDIVFVIDRGVLGFINSDGSGYTVRKVDLPNWRAWRPFTTTPELTYRVVWGSDGDYLIGRYSVVSLDSGIPLLIYTDGTFVKCSDDETSPYGEGRSWGISGKTILTAVHHPGYGPSKMILVDMTDCKVVSTLYIATVNETLREATISSQRWFAISRYFQQRDEVVIVKPDSTVVTTLPEALYPTWSPDGEWLAYSIYNDGLYVMRKDGTDTRKLTNAHFSLTPSWSPDGQWLIYSRDWVIFKLRLSDGNEYELFKGGNNPDWRWKKSTP